MLVGYRDLSSGWLFPAKVETPYPATIWIHVGVCGSCFCSSCSSFFTSIPGAMARACFSGCAAQYKGQLSKVACWHFRSFRCFCNRHPPIVKLCPSRKLGFPSFPVLCGNGPSGKQPSSWLDRSSDFTQTQKLETERQWTRGNHLEEWLKVYSELAAWYSYVFFSFSDVFLFFKVTMILLMWLAIGILYLGECQAWQRLPRVAWWCWSRWPMVLMLTRSEGSAGRGVIWPQKRQDCIVDRHQNTSARTRAAANLNPGSCKHFWALPSHFFLVSEVIEFCGSWLPVLVAKLL